MPDEEREAQLSESTNESTYVSNFPTWLRNTGSMSNSCSITKNDSEVGLDFGLWMSRAR